MRGPYDIGDEITLTFTWTVNGTPTDPSTEAGRVLEPDGTIQTLTLTKQSTGVYTAPFSPTKSGDHWYRGEGTGAAKAAEEKMFYVRPKRVT